VTSGSVGDLFVDSKPVDSECEGARIPIQTCDELLADGFEESQALDWQGKKVIAGRLQQHAGRIGGGADSNRRFIKLYFCRQIAGMTLPGGNLIAHFIGLFI